MKSRVLREDLWEIEESQRKIFEKECRDEETEKKRTKEQESETEQSESKNQQDFKHCK